MKRFSMIIILAGIVISLNTITASSSSIYIDDELCYGIKNDDSLWSWQYGTSDESKLLDNVKSVCHNYAIKTDGSLWTWDQSLFGFSDNPIKVMENVKDIDANDLFMFIVKDDNSLWAIGSNVYNNMGLIDHNINTTQPIKIMNNVKKAVIGESHGIILKTDGRIITTGLNTEGQLGIGKTELAAYRAYVDIDSADDIYAGRSSSYANTGNKLLMWGTTYEFDEDGEIYTQYIPKEYLSDVKQLVSKFGYNIVLKNDGVLWLYGAEKTEKEGYTEVKNGGIYFNLPYRVMDNVSCISEGTSDKFLVLCNDNSLYECNWEKCSTDYIPSSGELKIKKSSVNNIQKPNKEAVFEQDMFTDTINCSTEEKQAINSLSASKIVNGCSENDFCPDLSMNRAETAAVLLRMTGKNSEIGDCSYTDVTADKWYYGIAGASKKYGIIDGYDDNTFRGEDTISSLQLAVLAARTLRNEGTAAGLKAEQAITLPDNIPDWAAEDIEYAVKYGIITADEASELSDEKGMTRGEAAVVLYRLYNII